MAGSRRRGRNVGPSCRPRDDRGHRSLQCADANSGPKDASSPPLVIMTPRSSWWTSTAERGGGIAVWLACVRHFRERPRRPRCAVHGQYGSRTRPPRPGALHGATPASSRKERAAWIHLGANFAAADCHHAGTRLASGVRYQASPDLLDMGREALTAFGIAPAADHADPCPSGRRSPECL